MVRVKRLCYNNIDFHAVFDNIGDCPNK